MLTRVRINLLLVLICGTYPGFYTSATGQERAVANNDRHILTIFVTNSIRPIIWDSPSALYKSTIRGQMAKLFNRRQYLLGHMMVRLESPLVGGSKYSAMVSTSMREKRILVLKEQIGLGILGVAMGGELDSEKEIEEELKYFSRRNKLAYVKYLISEESARKIILFKEGFAHSENGDLPPSHYYGGAFWPRYHNEGAGCTAYGMAILDVAGLLAEKHNSWKVEVKIPMELVGGELNVGKKVSPREIKKTKTWVNPDNSLNQAYIPFSIYDPTIVLHWIKEQLIQSGEGNYVKEEEYGVPGLVFDMSHISPSPEDPVFIPRPEPSIFIEHFE